MAKQTFEDIQKILSARGCTLLEITDPRRIKIKYICGTCGKESETRLEYFNKQTEYNCKYCGMKGRDEKHKNSFEDVKACFDKEGYTLIATEYVHSRSKMPFVCPAGHNGQISYNSFQNGDRCTQCKIKRKAETEKKKHAEMFPDLDGEEWRVIPEIPTYSVSNKGRIKNNNNGKVRILNPRDTGYVHFRSEIGSHPVHRLVAQAFIPNPENKPTVNHLDKNPSNNVVENLEWATYREQGIHKYQNKEKVEYSLSGSRGVWRIDKETSEMLELYPSIQIACRWIDENLEHKTKNIHDIGSVITKACRHTKELAYGFKWEYDAVVNLPNEKWIDLTCIPDFFGYKISDQGRIINKRGRLLKPPTHPSGYVYVHINRQSHLVHVLVAKSFIDNPEHKPIVNHINTDKSDNRVSNLQWVSSKENCAHANMMGLNPNIRHVIQLNLNGDILREFKNCKDAAIITNLSYYGIKKCCNKQQELCGNHKWEWIIPTTDLLA